MQSFELKIDYLNDRLQIVIAKIQQSLPEMKRDGNNVLGSLWAELIYNEDSTSRSGSVLPQVEFIPKLAKQLQDSPAQIIADFEEIRRYGEFPLHEISEETSNRCHSNGPFWSPFLCYWQCDET